MNFFERQTLRQNSTPSLSIPEGMSREQFLEEQREYRTKDKDFISKKTSEVESSLIFLRARADGISPEEALRLSVEPGAPIPQLTEDQATQRLQDARKVLNSYTFATPRGTQEGMALLESIDAVLSTLRGNN